MNRSQELRNLMQQKRKLDSSSNSLSSKDKVKLLKMMKEKKKEELTAQPPDIKPRVTPAASINNTHDNTSRSNQSFELVSASVSQKKVEIRQLEQSVQPIVPDKETLPAGFFDDPVEDALARGIDLQKEFEKRKEVEEKEFVSFIGEVKTLESLQDDADEIEEEYKSLEDEALQMSYYSKLYNLYRKSTEVLEHEKSTGPRSEITKSSDRDDILRESEELSGSLLLARGSGISSNTADSAASNGLSAEHTDIRSELTKDNTETQENIGIGAPAISADSEVESFELLLKKRKKDKKKLKEAVDASSYIPLDFADWTARSI